MSQTNNSSGKGFDYTIKLLSIGDSTVGKSCLLLRFSDDTFQSNNMATIGIDFKIKKYNIFNKIIRLQVWDTAGQERFQTITRAYYKGAQGILLCYDITNEASFYNIRKWINEIQKHTNNSNNIKKILVATKCDLDSDRVITIEKGRELAKEYNIKYYETSAKDNINCNDVFMDLTKEILTELIDNENNTTNNSRNNSNKKSKDTIKITGNNTSKDNKINCKLC